MKTTYAIQNRWLLSAKKTADTEIILFCFHYAGGNAGIYLDWQKKLPAQVAVCPVQLPGRSNRFLEPCYTDLSKLIRDLAEAILPLLNRPFVFFGHSMGALISFELARFLRKNHKIQPLHMFVSGYQAPQLPAPGEMIHHLPEKEFLEGVRMLNGTPQEFFENEEILMMLLPLLRADFTICETYAYHEAEPLSCPMTAFGGLYDPDITVQHVQAWREQTSAAFQAYMLEGDHFFLHSKQDQLLSMIFATLADMLTKNGRVTR